MGLKEFVEKHPAAIAISLIVASVSATTVVIDYLCDRNLDAKQSLHEAEITELRTTLGAKISDLNRSLATIERGVGESKSYYDITKIFLKSESLSKLSTEHQSFQEGKFFVDAPSTDSWYHEETTEDALMSDRMGEVYTETTPTDIRNMLNSLTLDIWRHAVTLVFNLSLRKEYSEIFKTKSIKVKLYPHVFVQVLSKKRFKDIVSVTASSIAEEQKKMDDTIDRIAEPGKSLDHQTGKKDEIVSPESTIQALMEVGAFEMEDFINAQSEVMFEDITGYLLSIVLRQGFEFANFMEGAIYRVLSAQKRDNVFYLRNQLVLYGTKERSIDTERIILDREIFVIGTVKDIILVNIEVPSHHGQHKAFDWIAVWLTGLRVLF